MVSYDELKRTLQLYRQDTQDQKGETIIKMFAKVKLFLQLFCRDIPKHLPCENTPNKWERAVGLPTQQDCSLKIKSGLYLGRANWILVWKKPQFYINVWCMDLILSWLYAVESIVFSWRTIKTLINRRQTCWIDNDLKCTWLVLANFFLRVLRTFTSTNSIFGKGLQYHGKVETDAV